MYKIETTIKQKGVTKVIEVEVYTSEHPKLGTVESTEKEKVEEYLAIGDKVNLNINQINVEQFKITVINTGITKKEYADLPYESRLELSNFIFGQCIQNFKNGRYFSDYIETPYGDNATDDELIVSVLYMADYSPVIEGEEQDYKYVIKIK